MASYNFKVVLLGQGCVGKTSLVLRYVSNVFNDSHQSTLQASFLQKQLYLEQDLIRLNIWDTAGQEKFHALGPIYYREAQGALLVYDVACPDSLRKVRDWVKELNKMLGPENIRLAIVGNKADLLPASTTGASAAAVASKQNELVQEAIQFSQELLNARHYLTSAKLNQGIGELFVSLARRMVEQWKRRRELRAATNLTQQTRMARSLAIQDEAQEAASWAANNKGSRIDLAARSSSSSSSSRRGCQC